MNACLPCAQGSRDGKLTEPAWQGGGKEQAFKMAAKGIFPGHSLPF